MKIIATILRIIALAIPKPSLEGNRLKFMDKGRVKQCKQFERNKSRILKRVTKVSDSLPIKEYLCGAIHSAMRVCKTDEQMCLNNSKKVDASSYLCTR